VPIHGAKKAEVEIDSGGGNTGKSGYKIFVIGNERERDGKKERSV
jgi:hypothetical protein